MEKPDEYSTGLTDFSSDTEEILRQTNQKWEAILTATPDGIGMVSIDGKLQLLSAKLAAMYGYSIDEKDEYLGKSVFDFIDPTYHPFLIENIRQMLSGSINEKTTEYLAVKKDQSRFFTEVRSTVLRDANGIPTGILYIQRDISERKKAEDERREREELLNSIIETAKDSIFIKDSSLRYIKVNNAMASLFGMAEEDLIGKTDGQLFGEENAGHIDEIDQQVLLGSTVQEFPAKPVNGAMKHFHTIKVPIRDAHGHITGLCGIARDITERKLTEKYINNQNEKLNAIISAMPDLIFVLDKDGTYHEMYCSTPELLLIPPDQVIGMSLKNIFDDATAKWHIQNINACIRDKKLVTYEYSITKEKRTEYFESRIVPLGEDRVLAVVREITERKNAEMEIRDLNINLELKVRERTAELADANSTLLKEIEERKQAEEKQKKAKDEADKANKAKSEFLSRMSHELRTPMNSILGFAQLMAMSELTTKQKKSVDHIRNSGKHLLDLINEVLDIAKIESGRLVLSLQPVQLKGAILEIMEILHPNAAKLNQTLVLQNSASNEQSVIADLQRLRQILINIIINAIKYNREGESVVIRTELKTENESVRVSVSDSGQGIKPEYLDKLFQPFERMGAENTTIEGTGLGLPIVKKLVDAMKGSIGVDSRPGEGSTFWFELPVAQNQASQNSHSGDLLKTEPAESSIIGTILYIEDNLSNIELVEDIILTYRPDIRVISTTYGKTAVQFVIENSPDLIFLDLDLPDIHGSEVLFNLLENAGTKAVPTIIISADAMPQQISRLMEAGAKEYLTKPLDIQAFLNVVDEWMGKE